MSRILTFAGHARPTKAAKALIAASMYHKGRAFLGAAMLLRKRQGYEYVVLHLICQGLEVILKGVLLAIDYDHFMPKLKSKRNLGLGHNLLASWDAAASAAHLSPIKGAVRQELEKLNTLYSQHRLRYGSTYDLLVDPRTIPSERVLKRTMALLKTVERKRIVNTQVT